MPTKSKDTKEKQSKKVKDASKKTGAENVKTKKKPTSTVDKLKVSTMAMLSKTKFYEDGYKRSLTILVLSLFIFIFFSIATFWSLFVYKPNDNYIPVDEKNEIIEEISLERDYLTREEISQWITDALIDINSFTYRNVGNHQSKIKKYFLNEKYKSFYSKWKKLSLITFVKKNKGIVEVKSIRPESLTSVIIDTPEGKRKGYKFSYIIFTEVYGNRSYSGKSEWSGYIVREKINKSVNGYAIVNLISK